MMHGQKNIKLVWQLFHRSTSQHCTFKLSAISSNNMIDVGTAPHYFIIVILCMIRDFQLLMRFL